MTKSNKCFDTGLRVLEVLKILLREDISKVDLIEKLKENSKIGNVYTQEAFIKYFNTLEVLGFEVKKNKTKYGLKNGLAKISFTDKEKEIFYSLIKEVPKLYDKSKKDAFKNFLSRLNKYFDFPLDMEKIEYYLLDEKTSYDDNIKTNLIATLKNYLDDKQLVKIRYRRTKNIVDELTVEIKDIIEKKNNIFINCYCSNLQVNKKISIDSILSLVQLPNKTSSGTFLNPVIFRLTGSLVAAYKLKPFEKVIDFSSYHLTISNSSDDKDALLRRLLKYGESCVIQRPLCVKKEFIAMTNEILNNLQEEK